MMTRTYSDKPVEDHREETEVSKWFTELKIAEKDKHYDRFKARAERAIKRFCDERTSQTTADGFDHDGKRFNVLWSNVQTLGPAIYARVPKPQVDRRKRNRDPVAATASEILERALDYNVQAYDFDHNLVNVRDDYLLTAFGQMWVRYEAEYGPEQLDEQGQPFKPVVYEKVCADYVHWSDFRNNPARTWDEVRWVARRVYLSKAQLAEKFGKEVADAVSLDYVPQNISDDKELSKEQDEFRKAVVWEIWDKPTRTVKHVCKGYPKYLKDVPDPLGLQNFFPCPRPLTGVRSTKSVWPIPDFAQYQDQATELDEITARIHALVKALRVVGIYDASKESLKRLLSEAGENEMIPVEDWASFATVGGIKGVVDFLPLSEIVQTLTSLYDARGKTLNEIYELTGISDIVRGNSSPSETATAQQIKGQFATLRLSDRQKAMQRFARDVIAIKGEIIAEHFDPNTLAQILGVDMENPEIAQNFMSAVQLLKDEKLRSFRIDIETDSTISINEEQEKQTRAEFLTSIGPFLQQASQTIAVDPIWGSVIGEMLMYSVRGFKAGRALESTIQNAVDQAAQQAIQAQQQQAEAAQQPPPEPPPDPKMMEVQGKMQLEQARFQFEQQQHADRMSFEQQKISLESQLKQMEAQLKQIQAQHAIEIEREKLNGNLALQEEKIRADMALKAFQRPDQNNLDTIESLRKPEPTPIPAPIINVHIDNKQKPKPVIEKIVRGPDGSMMPVYAEATETPASESGEYPDGD